MFAPIFSEVQTIVRFVIMTMITGVFGAASHFDMEKRILSFPLVSQIGYMVLGLAFMTPLAITTASFIWFTILS